MLSFSSIQDYSNADLREKRYKVQSSKCWYIVQVLPDYVRLRGPGVDETYDIDDLPENLSDEGKALAVVIYFEEQE